MGIKSNNTSESYYNYFGASGLDAVQPPPSTQGDQDCMPIYWTNADGTSIRDAGTKFWNDANASYLKVAVPYNGTNGGTTFSDVHANVPGASGSNHTFTVTGNSQTSTATSKYYGSSGLFDGSGDYLTGAANTDWSLDGDFTIEGWMNIDSGQKGIICSVGDASNNGTDGFEFYAAQANDFRVYGNGTGGGTAAYWFGTGNGTFADGSWNHFALVRESNVAKAYINGTDIGKTYTTNTTYNGQLTLAAEYYDSGYDGHDGYLQDFRLYKGVAKYTSNFTIFPG